MKFSGLLLEIKDGDLLVFRTSEKVDVNKLISSSDNPNYIQAEITFGDNRKISLAQRRKIYALLNDFSDYTGDSVDRLKEYLKDYFCEENQLADFSLSDCSINTARNFISYLIEFAFLWGIPFKTKGLELQDDIQRYLWLCIKYRRCSICGRQGEIHHIDAVGQGRDRRTIEHSEHELICLCRQHHNEAHNLGVNSFRNKYLVQGIKLNPEDVKAFGI